MKHMVGAPLLQKESFVIKPPTEAVVVNFVLFSSDQSVRFTRT